MAVRIKAATHRSVAQVLDSAVEVGRLADDARQVGRHRRVEERSGPRGGQVLQEVGPELPRAPGSCARTNRDC